MVDKEKIQNLEKNINKWIIRVIIGGVLVFEKYPVAVEWIKTKGKEIYLHLMEQYKRFKKEMGV